MVAPALRWYGALRDPVQVNFIPFFKINLLAKDVERQVLNN